MLSPNPQGVAVVNVNFLARHRQTADKTISALERAMFFMKEHDSKSRQILIKRMKLSDDAAARCVFLYMLPHAQINVSIFQQYSDMLTELGELKSKVQVDDLVYRN